MAIDASLRDRILRAVDDQFPAQLSFTQELVRHPSLRTQEASAQDLMEQAMTERGLKVDRWTLDPAEIAAHEGAGIIAVSYDEVDNVVGTFTPAVDEGRSLILNGHIDVVPTGPESEWATSPWDARIEGDWLYGRGSGDMKAGLAANLFALDALTAAGLEPTARIHVESVVEEECTGNGSLSALQRGYTAEAVLIPEPEEDMLVRANVGVIWFTVRVAGDPTHPREMTSGFNAIDAAHEVITHLRLLEERWNAARSAHRYFEDLDHPINLNLGIIAGGDWASSVPAWCQLDLRVALYPGVTAEDAWQEITEHLATFTTDASGHPIRTTVERNGFFAQGYVLEEGSDAEAVLRDAHRDVFGRELETFVTPGYLDARVFTQYAGIPSLTYGPISEAIHGYDERVSIASINHITKAMALFIAEWCGVREIG